ncbi:MAG: RodZ domain-containing protein [Elusimicrobiota bacterium]
MDIGSKLRETRQNLGLSVEDISAKTLIGVKYLHSIEENKFSDIPAEVMTLGFLRNYSVVLGLNSDEIISEYKKSNPIQFPKITIVRINGAPIKKTIKIKIVPVLITVVGIVFLLGLIKIISTIVKSDKTLETTSEKIAIKKNHLEIQTTDNVWIRIKEGENPIFEGIIPPNAIKTFESTEQFSLRIGNLSGITVSLNGTPVELPKGKLVGDIKLP